MKNIHFELIHEIYWLKEDFLKNMDNIFAMARVTFARRL